MLWKILITHPTRISRNHKARTYKFWRRTLLKTTVATLPETQALALWAELRQVLHVSVSSLQFLAFTVSAGMRWVSRCAKECAWCYLCNHLCCSCRPNFYSFWYVHCVTKKVTPYTVCDRNDKSEHILLRFCQLDSEIFCENLQNFIWKYCLIAEYMPVARGIRTIRTNAPFCASALFCLAFFMTQPRFHSWFAVLRQYKLHCACLLGV